MSTFTEQLAALNNVQAVISDVKSLYDKLSLSLGNIPEPYKSLAIREIREIASGWNGQAVTQADLPKPKQSDPPPLKTRIAGTVEEKTVTDALLELLSRHPNGLTYKEIQDQLIGRFKTDSEEPKRVITTTIAALIKRKKKLIKGLDKRVRINHDSVGKSDHAQRETAAGTRKVTLKQRVESFFKEHGNKAATVASLSEILQCEKSAIRTLISTNANDFTFVDFAEGGQKLWKLNEPQEV